MLTGSQYPRDRLAQGLMGFQADRLAQGLMGFQADRLAQGLMGFCVVVSRNS